MRASYSSWPPWFAAGSFISASIIPSGFRWRRRSNAEARARLLAVWSQHAYLANALVFLLMGVTITVLMFEDRWLAMLVGIGAATVARAVVVYLGVPAASALLPGERVSRAYRHVMFWGGVRGAVMLALALSMLLAVPWWYTAQSVGYGVGLFSLFVQVPTMPLLLRSLSAKSEQRAE